MSRNEYGFRNVFTPIWLTIIHRNAFYANEIDGNLFVYIRDFTSGGALRHRDHEGTPAWKKTNVHQPGEPTEKDTDLYGHQYTIYVGNSPIS